MHLSSVDEAEDRVHGQLMKISTEFCSWARNLPGDSKILELDPEDIWYIILKNTQTYIYPRIYKFLVSSIFDASQSVNPGESALGRGLTSWAQFGSSVSGAGKFIREMKDMKEVREAGHLDSLAFAQPLCNTDLNTRAWSNMETRGGSHHQLSRGYGAWYMAPSQWNEKLKKSSQTNMDSDKYSLEVSGEFLILLKSNLNKVNISGVRKDIGTYEEHEDVLHLSSTKGFFSFCRENTQYCRPEFVTSSAKIS